MNARNCRCRKSHPLSGRMIVAGVLVFAALTRAGQEDGSGGRFVALGEGDGAWGDVTAGGAPNAGQANDPVSTSIGEYRFTKPLMSLGGPLPLEFSLYYASRIEKWMGGYSDPFGEDGFTHDYHVALRGDPNAVQVLYARGNMIAFNKQGNAWRIAGEEIIYQLKETNGYYYLLDPIQGRIYTFKKATAMGGQVGALVRIEDRNGNALKFTNTQDNAYYIHPARIEDGLGRSLEFTYQDPAANWKYPHLSKVTDQNGRTIQFAYDVFTGQDSGMRLKSVTDAAGHKTTFSYVGSLRNRALSSQTLPRGNRPYTQTYGHETMPGGNAADWPWRVTAQTDAYGNTARLAFDDANAVTTITDPLGQKYRHAHEYRRLLANLTDETGRSINLRYDALGRCTTVIDRLGGATRVAYHPETGKIAEHTDAEGNTTVFTYQAQQQTFTNPLVNEKVTFTFYNLVKVAGADGSRVQFTYDAKGNVLTHTDPSGEKSSFTYNGRGQPVTISNPAGGAVSLTYNPDGTVASVVDPEAGTTLCGYDSYQRLRQITRPDGRTVRFAYGLDDRLLSCTNEQGKILDLAYDDNGNLTSGTDLMRQTTTQTYDLMDQPIRQADPLGHATQYSYDALGRLKTATDRSGNMTTCSYDPRGWLTGITDPAGNTWTIAYDDEGVPKATTTPTGISTTLQADKLGRTTEITDSWGGTTKFAYDGRGRLTSTTDREGRAATYVYDACGRLVSATKPLLGTATYTRGALGGLTRITDLRGQFWDFSYSPMGRLTSATDPLGNRWTYAYDARGQLLQTSYPGGGAATLTRDPVGRITRAAYPGGPALDFTYDNAGRLLMANDLKLSRDARGDIVNSQDGTASFGATYDAGRRISAVTYDGRATVAYTYDARNLLTRVSDSLAGAWMEFAYNADGRLVQVLRSNDVPTTYTYDQAGRLIRIQDDTRGNQQYVLNAEGEPTQAVMNIPLGAGTIGYAYDEVDRLTGADYSNGNRLSYTYDSGGNLTRMTGRTPLEPAPRTDSFSYDNASRINSPEYGSDGRGRLTAAPGRSFAYDGAGRLVSIAAGGATATLTYNGLGDLRTRRAGSATTTYYHNYALGLSPVMAEKEGTSYRRFYVYAPSGRLLYLVDPVAKAVRFYHFDRLGSTLFLTDGAGAVSDGYAYDPYGKLVAHSGSSDQPFTFVGRHGVRWEPVGNLYHMRARYYDPATARFLSRDPVWPVPADPQSLNPYQYVAQNPLHYVDHLGTDGWDPTVPHIQTGLNAYVAPGQQTPTQPSQPAKPSTYAPPTAQSLQDQMLQDAINQASISAASTNVGPITPVAVAVTGPWGEATAYGTVITDTPLGEGNLTAIADITTTGGQLTQSFQVGDTGIATSFGNSGTTVGGGALATGPGDSSAMTLVAVNPTVAGTYVQTQFNLPLQTGAGALFDFRPITHGNLQAGGNLTIAGEQLGLTFGFEGFKPTVSLTLPFLGTILGSNGGCSGSR